ncbi:glutamate receptor [Micractinium conductrix]|uniref:Glutamate receptor n=1 Tax=Micractinium conductrix TaxID=554055 RepID=A0A2P6VMQ0_9CHLO|nr:glutamate receptor [Micractinium conductrix]|eukprot:PSC75360.1 glutamate receptor [Micractinium conductrix]
MLPYTVAVSLALVALLQGGPLAAAQPAGAPAPGPLAAGPLAAPQRLVVCVVEGSPPMSNCSVGAEGSTLFSGYDVEVLRHVAVRLNPPFLEGEDYEMRCMPFNATANSLLTRDGVCDLALGAITTSTAREQAGVMFSRVPTYSPSLAVMVPASFKQADGWFWTKPYDLSAWLAILLTLLAFPLLVFVVETVALKASTEQDESWRDIMYQLYVQVNWFDLDGQEVRATATRIVLFVYFLMSIFLVEAYAANLAAFLTVQQLTSTVTSISQLKGRAVGTLPVYAERLQRSGLATTLYPPESVEDITAVRGPWLSDLASGKLAAFVFDEPLLRYADKLTGCDFKLLPDTFDQFNYAFAFPNTTRPSTIDAVDDAILQLQEDGTLEQLRQMYIRAGHPDEKCTSQAGNSPRITFVQFYGLWVVWGAALVVALALALAMYLRRWRRRRRATNKCKQPDLSSSRRSSSKLRSRGAKDADGMGAAAAAAASAEDSGGGSATSLLLQLLEAEAEAAAAQHARLAAAVAAARRRQTQPEAEKESCD